MAAWEWRVKEFYRRPKKISFAHMKVRDVVTALEKDGWTLIRTEGGHKTFKNEGVRDLLTFLDTGEMT